MSQSEPKTGKGDDMLAVADSVDKPKLAPSPFLQSETPSTSNESYNSNRSVQGSGIKRILLAGLVLLVALIVGTLLLPSGRILFFSQNFLALVVLVVISIQAYIHSGLWKVMDQSLKRTDAIIGSMREQAGFMKNQADAALRAAEMATGQLVAMQHQEQAQFSALEETRKIVEQNERAIAATDKNIELAERNNIYAQRAYVVAKIRKVRDEDAEPYVIKDTLWFWLRVENDGKTPENNVVVQFEYGLRDQPPCLKTNNGRIVCDEGFTHIERLGVVAPNGRYHVIRTAEVPLPSGDQYEAWKFDKARFYCWGKISYEDIFNEARWTWFCFFQSQAYPYGFPCDYGNSAI